MPNAKKKRKTKAPSLSKASSRALEAFDASAQTWGLLSDRGCGPEVGRSEASYEEDKLALQRRIAALERACKRLRGATNG